MKKYIPYLFGCMAAVVALLPAKVSAQTTMFFENFENPAAFATNWLVDTSYPEDEIPILWGVVNNTFGGETPRAGTNKLYCAASNFLGDEADPLYLDNTSTSISRDVDLTGYKTATLTFWYKLRLFPGSEEEFDEYDADILTVLINDDPVFSSDADIDRVVAVKGAWAKVTLNISGYADQVCNVKFDFFSDGSSQDIESAGEGAYLDDILLTAYHAYRPDYNKDDSTDLLVQYTDSRTAVWRLSGAKYLSAQWLNANKPVGGWRLAGQTDFNLDGNCDIFWHNPATGATMAWYMDGANRLRQIAGRKMAVGWKVAALTDLDRNGSQDIIWQNAAGSQVAWYMNPTNQVAFLKQVAFSKSVGPYVNVVGAGDFNYDGNQDLILQDKRTGSMRVRYLTAGVKALQAIDPYITLAAPIKFSVGWRAVGTQDFNGDGTPDLIMHHTNGTIVAWILEGMKVTNGTLRVIEQRIIRKAPLGYTVGGHR